MAKKQGFSSKEIAEKPAPNDFQVKEIGAEDPKSIWRLTLYTLATFVIVLATVQVTRTIVLLQRFGRQSQEVLSEWKQVKNGLEQYGKDLNEIREYLLLPPAEYNFFTAPANESASDDQNDPVASGIYQFLDQVSKDHALSKRRNDYEAALRNLKNDAEFSKTLQKLNLGLSGVIEDSDGHFAIKLLQKEPVIQIVLEKPTAQLKMMSVLGSHPLEVKEGQTVPQAVTAYLNEKTESIIKVKNKVTEEKNAVQTLWQNAEVSKLLAEKKLQVRFAPLETEFGFVYDIQTMTSEVVASLTLRREDGQWQIGEKIYPKASELKSDFVATLQNLKANPLSKKAEEEQKKLQAIFEESAFKEALKVSQLEIGAAQDKDNRVSYDLKTTTDQAVIGQIILDKTTGQILLKRMSDGVEMPLSFLSDGSEALGSKKNG